MVREHRLELTGQGFGWWKVIAKGDLGPRGEVFWKCRCICGTEREVRAGILRRGDSTNCGCKRGVHRQCGSRTYKSWDTMKQRCSNPKSRDYERYGKRGIKVCERWRNSFDNFLADMGERPEGKTLDRIDNDGNYEPGNCKWSTTKEQSLNKRNSLKAIYLGKLTPLIELAALKGLPLKVLVWRLKNDWELNRALETPVISKRRTK